MARDPNEVTARLQRARRACEDIAIVQQDIVLTIAESRRILAIIRPKDASPPAPAAPRIAAGAPADVTDQALMLAAVRQVIAILAEFPGEMQFQIIKVLTMRAIVVGTMPMPAPTITLTA